MKRLLPILLLAATTATSTAALVAHDVWVRKVDAAGTSFEDVPLNDPGADRVLGWDEATNTVIWTTAGAGDLLAANNLSDLASAATARTNLGFSANGASLVTAANYAAMRTLLDLESGVDFDPAGTDNSTDVTLAGAPDYLTIAGQVITRGLVDFATDTTGSVTDAQVDDTITASNYLPLAGGTMTGNLELGVGATISGPLGVNIDAGVGTMTLIQLNGVTKLSVNAGGSTSLHDNNLLDGGILNGDGLQLLEGADHPDFVVATKGQIWLKNTTPSQLWYTDDAATDIQLGTFLPADRTKLDGIEAAADVTDAANVTDAGALMDSELASIADVKALDQSVVSGSAPTFLGTNITGTAAGLTAGSVTTNANLTGTVTSTGNATAFADDPTFVGNLSVGDGATGSGILRIYEDTDSGVNFASFQVPALAANTTYTLPSALGGAGTYLTDAAGDGTLSWATPAGSGDVSKVGTPLDSQIGVWTGDGTIEGDADFTFDTATNTFALAPAAGTSIISVGGTNFVLDSPRGTLTLANVDAVDATTEATLEAAIDSLVNQTVTGTIGTGTWQGTAVASAFLDADTAHLTTTQTFTGVKTFGSAGAVGRFKLAGSTSGSTILNAAAVAGAGTVVLPTTGTLLATTGSGAGLTALNATQLTSGTIPAARIGAATIDTLTEIAAGLKSGADAKLVTGTAGTSGNLAQWNADGDLVDGPAALVTESDTFTILEPDTTQGITDIVLLKFFPAEKYPSGVTMVSAHIGASAAYTSETFNLEESASPTGSTPSTVEAITLTTSSNEDDGTFSDGAIAADGYIFVDLDDTPEDVAAVSITLTWTIN